MTGRMTSESYRTNRGSFHEPRRICVEWGFKEITQQWTFLDFKQKKIFKFPVAKYYIVGAFLLNIRNCFYDNQTALYFKCNQQNGTKMSLDEYLGLVNHEEIPNELG
jgi:hypothetical protein